MTPGMVFSSPRFLISTKFGMRVNTGGIIIAVRNRKNSLSRPRNSMRANA